MKHLLRVAPVAMAAALWGAAAQATIVTTLITESDWGPGAVATSFDDFGSGTPSAAQDLSDGLVYCQGDNGGWYYSCRGDGPDGSTNGWAPEGLRLLNRKYGAETYNWARDRQREWLLNHCRDNCSYHGGGPKLPIVRPRCNSTSAMKFCTQCFLSFSASSSSSSISTWIDLLAFPSSSSSSSAWGASSGVTFWICKISLLPPPVTRVQVRGILCTEIWCSSSGFVCLQAQWAPYP